MISAVDQRHHDIDHREAGDNARSQHAVEALFDARDVFLRHVAADDLRFEDEAGAGLAGLDDTRPRELAGTAGLLLVGVSLPRFLVTLSRYATCGAPTMASTL